MADYYQFDLGKILKTTSQYQDIIRWLIILAETLGASPAHAPQGVWSQQISSPTPETNSGISIEAPRGWVRGLQLLMIGM